jgi:HNH endonuclease
MPHRLYPQVAARADSRCEYCLAPEAISPDRFQVEHVLPRARGGSDDFANLALACAACNRRKSQATQALDVETWTIVALFSPRQDVWDTHFRIHLTPDGITIVGLTPTGRATVQRLDTNDPHVVSARVRWSAVGLFPP